MESISVFIYLFYTIQSIIYLIYIVIDSDCGEPLLEKAVLRATSSLPDRGPENAILNGNYKFVFFFIQVKYIPFYNYKFMNL